MAVFDQADPERSRASDGSVGAEERRLVSRLRAGELDAVEELYTAYRTPIFGFLLRLARDRHVAEDLFQNTWVKVSRSVRRLREDTDLRAWIFTVARNEFRSHRRWQLVDLSQIFLIGMSPDDPVRDSNRASEGTIERDIIEKGLALLGERDREVLLLVGVEGLSAEQAAGVVGVSYAALRQRLARARARFKEALLELGHASKKET
jgi:RNA polymerase sigma-70 factor (ECF subfamily)